VATALAAAEGGPDRLEHRSIGEGWRCDGQRRDRRKADLEDGVHRNDSFYF
jgi:hypothetical protein